jgi:integrase
MREAFELEVISTMPRLPPLPPKAKKLPAAPPLEVVRHLLGASRGWLQGAIALAVFGSQRNGEVRALRVMDVDFKELVVSIRKAFSADAVVSQVGRRARPTSRRATPGDPGAVGHGQEAR